MNNTPNTVFGKIHAALREVRDAYWSLGCSAAVYDGIRIPVGKHLSPLLRTAIMTGTYEYDELRILRQQLTPSDRVMELGTGIGLLSALSARVCGNNNVFTYEANPELERHIRNVYQLNGVDPSLNIYMLGTVNGVQPFHISTDFWSSSSLPVKNSRMVMVPVRSFNAELDRVKPTFLIVDIEGGEFELFKHARLHGVNKLLIEIHPERLSEYECAFVIDRIRSQGLIELPQLAAHRELYFYRP